MRMSEAYERIEARVKELQAAHPRLNLTFGYIGNYDERLPEPYRDDRGWYIWAKVGRCACGQVRWTPLGGESAVTCVFHKKYGHIADGRLPVGMVQFSFGGGVKTEDLPTLWERMNSANFTHWLATASLTQEVA